MMTAQQIEDKLNSVFGEGAFTVDPVNEHVFELADDAGCYRYHRDILEAAAVAATDTDEWKKWIDTEDPSEIWARIKVFWDRLQGEEYEEDGTMQCVRFQDFSGCSQYGGPETAVLRSVWVEMPKGLPLNRAQAYWAAFIKSSLTSGPNWRCNTSEMLGGGFIRLLGYGGSVTEVEFSHCEDTVSRLDLFCECMALAFGTDREEIEVALAAEGWDFEGFAEQVVREVHDLRF